MDDKVYTALGLMSGTSLDGVDIAVIETDGVDIFGFGPSQGSEFDDDALALRLATKAAVAWGAKGPPPNSLMAQTNLVDTLHIQAVEDIISDQSCEFDLIGYHGQTVFHLAPTKNKLGRTLQLGNGQTLADHFNAPVAYDFRTADVQSGGQGAPLAPIYHEALVRYSKLEGRVAVLNIGGVSNVTAIEDGKIIWATDCGPGNGPLDSWIELKTGRNFDLDGRLSKKGEVEHGIINQWLEQDFFKRDIPRSADRYDFDVLPDMRNLSSEDGAATLASFCAQSIAQDISKFDADTVIVCGGGRKNPTIMAMLDSHIDSNVALAEDVGWNGDMLEAQAFAFLAVRTLKGLPISFPETTGCPEPMTGGKVVYPNAT